MLQFLLSLSDESNHEKITSLYDKYHDFMIRFAASKFINKGCRNHKFDAEDAVQNAFIKIVQNIEKINFSYGDISVKNYIFSILNNEICNIVTRNKQLEEFNENLFQEEETADSYIETLDMLQSYEEIVNAIKELDEKYSSIIFLLYCKEMSVNEISELMGISVKTVYTRISRGKKLLLDFLHRSNV